MIHPIIATKLSTMFPDNDIKINPSGKTLFVNGTSLSFSGFKEGMLGNFSKFSPEIQVNILNKVSEQVKPYLNTKIEVAVPIAEKVVKITKIIPIEQEKPVERVVETPPIVAEEAAMPQEMVVEEESPAVAEDDEKPKPKRKTSKK